MEGEGACKTSEAVVISMYPDVCLKNGTPVPYDLHGLSSDDIRPSKDVRYTKLLALNEGTRLSTSYGDDPADAGVQSGTVKGMCRPVDNFAEGVRVDSLRAVRHDTIFEMNCSGPDGASNTKGKLCYVKNQKPADDDKDKKRKETLQKLRDHYGKSDFYKQLADYDPAHADEWNKMADVQNQFQSAEPGYDDATRAYSESMRETLHQSTINLFDDPAALQQAESSDNGLYNWYVGMHGTAFDQNGAWNTDFLGRGTNVMWNTPSAMYTKLGKVNWLDHDEPHAKKAVEQVRERRAKAGLRVSMKPGEKLPETKKAVEDWNKYVNEHPEVLWPGGL